MHDAPGDGAAEAAPLSAALRTGTREAHAAAESSPFVTALLAGRLSVAAYADLAAQQLVVYRALEAAGERVAGTAWGRTLVLPVLARTRAIEADLAHLWGPGWRGRVAPVPAVQPYAARLTEVGATAVGYPAHAYVRYLGDLSGGQAVARLVRRHYGVDDAALGFYRFEVPSLKHLKDDYRARLDALPLGPGQRAAVVAEAAHAFALSRALFDDLGSRHAAAVGRASDAVADEPR